MFKKDGVLELIEYFYSQIAEIYGSLEKYNLELQHNKKLAKKMWNDMIKLKDLFLELEIIFSKIMNEEHEIIFKNNFDKEVTLFKKLN